ncbi:MAG: DciA family protein [bacterium]|nr:DciA family protein [bacterium]
MRHIKLIIPKVINKIKLKDNLDDNTIREQADKIIKKNTPNAEVFFYKNKSLYIYCQNQIIASELFLNQEAIKEKVNKFLEKDIVRKLVIKVR